MPVATLTVVTCAALLIAVLALWAPGRMWAAALLLAIVLGYWSQVLHGPAILWIVLLGASVWLYPRYRAAALPIIVLTVLLGMHALPGFSNPLIAKDVVLSAGAAPYTLYFNFDKTIAGILLLAVAGVPLLRFGSKDAVHQSERGRDVETVARPHPNLPPQAGEGAEPAGGQGAWKWGEAVRLAAPIIVLNVIVAMLLSIAFGYVRFQPKWTSFFWLWAIVNLLLTCLSEEAFFRGFVQRELTGALRGKRWGAGVAIGASAVLFGAAHFAGGWRYVLLASVAGAGYGIAYHRSRSIEMAMLAHFALNATHFLLFTYPSLG